MSELSILQALAAAGMSSAGAFAMGGNMWAESGFLSSIAQRGTTKLSDADYTLAADTGGIDFAHDGVGYGLCQWTYPTRKAELLHFAKKRGKSVGDEAMQVEFCIAELKRDYPDLWAYLCETQNLPEATERICREYERPAVNNISVRAKYANDLYMWYADIIENGELRMKNGQSNNNSQFSTINSQFVMPVIRRGDRSPEARYLADKLAALGYDVLWDGLWACVVDYQQKRNLTVDGVCGAETWGSLMEN